MIPKIIHYCWLSNDPFPTEFEEYMQTWKEKLSDYDFIKWDFSRFDKESSDWVKEAFENKKYAFAADYIRLYAIYNYGGIYLDMDIKVIRSFNDLLDSEQMFAYEGEPGKGIEAGCFGAIKGNVFVKKALDYYTNRHFVDDKGRFDTKTLPLILQEIYDEKSFNFTLFSKDYFTAKSQMNGLITVTSNTYAIHNFAGSWKSEKSKKREQKRYWTIFLKVSSKCSKVLHKLFGKRWDNKKKSILQYLDK